MVKNCSLDQHLGETAESSAGSERILTTNEPVLIRLSAAACLSGIWLQWQRDWILAEIASLSISTYFEFCGCNVAKQRKWLSEKKGWLDNNH